MRRNFIAWVIFIVFALALYLFSNGSVTLALLVALIAAPLFSYAILRLTRGNAVLTLKEAEAPAEPGSFILSMENKGMLPVPSVEAKAVCVNLRTGETDSFDIKRGLWPHKKLDIALQVVPEHAGRYEVTVSSAVIRDPLGMWSYRTGFNEHVGVTIMPKLYDVNIHQAGVTAMPESDTEAAKTRGAVSGDMIDIKEYVPGDPVRNIHWKLSEKTGKSLVKVLGNPVSDQYLLLLDNQPELAHDPEALDTIASVYSSLIHTLRSRDIVCYAGWTDPVTGKAVIRRVADDNEAAAAADEYLAVPAVLPGAFSGISRGIADDRYAHVVIVGSRIPSNIDAIANGCSVTVLKYGEIGSFTDGSMTVVGFDKATYVSDTAGIEI